MKKIIALIGLALFSFALAAQTPKSMLWKIEKDGYKTSYLFGTIHILPAAEYEMSEELVGAITKCEALVIEADLSDQAQVMKAMEYARMPDGMRLDELISEEDYALVDSALQASVGTPLAPFVTFKPFFIESLFASTLVKEDPMVLDMAITDLVKTKRTPVLTLETIEEQMTLFDSIPFKEQMQDLADYFKGNTTYADEYRKMLDLYLDSDLDGLNALLNGAYENQDMLYFLLEKRNKRWIPQLEGFMKEDELLIAVGAGHLVGETGLINLLKKQGFTVTPAE